MPETTHTDQTDEPTPAVHNPRNKTFITATAITAGTAILGFMAYATVAYTVDAFNPETIKHTTVKVEKTLTPEPVTVTTVEQAKACNSYIKETQLNMPSSPEEIITKLEAAASKTTDTQLADQIRQAATIYAAMYSEAEPDPTLNYSDVLTPLQTCFDLGIYPTE